MCADVAFGPEWTYVDRINFKEDRRLKVATLLGDDPLLAAARATLSIAAPHERVEILKALSAMIARNTELLRQGPDADYPWTKQMLIDLGIVQVYLEGFKRTFGEIMAIVSGDRPDAAILQVISRGVVIEKLRVPLTQPAPRQPT